MSKWLVLVALASVLSAAAAKNWVLIVAGANTYDNYFSQSTACHAYHTVLKAGVPAENIIHMSYDDVARNHQNPYKNNLVVLPNGTNVYEGCKIDYKGLEVHPKAFLKILQGDKAGLLETIGRKGPVIDSGPDDHVFVTMVDHGGPNVFYFPFSMALHSSDFIKALKNMHENKRYKKMVIYVESCESGSMFDQILPNNISIYGSTCANPHESGYMCCFDEKRNVFVGTLYANGWEFDTDNGNTKVETILDQYEVMKKACNTTKLTSHPQQYGDLSINKEVIGQYQGNIQTAQVGPSNEYDDWVREQLRANSEKLTFAGIDLVNPPMDMVAIATRARRLINDGLSKDEISKLKTELFQLLEIKRIAGEFVRDIAVRLLGKKEAIKLISDKQTLQNHDCYKEALSTLNAVCPGLHFGKYPFIRKNLHTIANLCNTKPYTEVIEAIMAASRSQKKC